MPTKEFEVDKLLRNANMDEREQESRVCAWADRYPFRTRQRAFRHVRINKHDFGAFGLRAGNHRSDANRTIQCAADAKQIFRARIVGFNLSGAVKALAEHHTAPGNRCGIAGR